LQYTSIEKFTTDDRSNFLYLEQALTAQGSVQTSRWKKWVLAVYK